MKKLKLRVENLHVLSFISSPAPEARGTVHGNYPTQDTCEGPECYTGFLYTCEYTEGSTCQGDTCENSCQGTCWEQTACFECPS